MGLLTKSCYVLVVRAGDENRHYSLCCSHGFLRLWQVSRQVALPMCVYTSLCHLCLTCAALADRKLLMCLVPVCIGVTICTVTDVEVGVSCKMMVHLWY